VVQTTHRKRRIQHRPHRARLRTVPRRKGPISIWAAVHPILVSLGGRQRIVWSAKPTHGGSLDAAGPAVVKGMVLVNSGYNQLGGMLGNVLLAF
jgi:hypothetical protein